MPNPVGIAKCAQGPRGTQAEVAKRTGCTRERIRQIVRDGAPVPANRAIQTPEPWPHSPSEENRTGTGDLPPPMATP
ncbi:sigma factor-like helix-turn-helix DNA-binding protein [Mycobacterium sp. smrl_JER01]|uniref:sigma factor-like helix-turn-helix DNA-binding protein n=1 Tax=unclassified Mycobacterium TaxID=2642494 RepID=UPI00352A4090